MPVNACNAKFMYAWKAASAFTNLKKNYLVFKEPVLATKNCFSFVAFSYTQGIIRGNNIKFYKKP